MSSLIFRSDFRLEFLVIRTASKCRRESVRNMPERIVGVWMLAITVKMSGKNRYSIGRWIAEMWFLFDIEYWV